MNEVLCVISACLIAAIPSFLGDYSLFEFSATVYLMLIYHETKEIRK